MHALVLSDAPITDRPVHAAPFLPIIAIAARDHSKAGCVCSAPWADDANDDAVGGGADTGLPPVATSHTAATAFTSAGNANLSFDSSDTGAEDADTPRLNAADRIDAAELHPLPINRTGRSGSVATDAGSTVGSLSLSPVQTDALSYATSPPVVSAIGKKVVEGDSDVRSEVRKLTSQLSSELSRQLSGQLSGHLSGDPEDPSISAISNAPTTPLSGPHSQSHMLTGAEVDGDSDGDLEPSSLQLKHASMSSYRQAHA